MLDYMLASFPSFPSGKPENEAMCCTSKHKQLPYWLGTYPASLWVATYILTVHIKVFHNFSCAWSSMSKLKTKQVNSCWVCHNKIDAYNSSYSSLSWFDHSANNLGMRLHTCRDMSELFIVLSKLYEVGYPGRAPTPALLPLRNSWTSALGIETTL